jgi:hypothetical protein
MPERLSMRTSGLEANVSGNGSIAEITAVYSIELPEFAGEVGVPKAGVLAISPELRWDERPTRQTRGEYS